MKNSQRPPDTSRPLPEMVDFPGVAKWMAAKRSAR
jgi:hypothetical protein